MELVRHLHLLIELREHGRVDLLVDAGNAREECRANARQLLGRSQRIGQGRENAKMFLKDSPALMAEVEEKVKVVLGITAGAAEGGAEETTEE